MALLSPVLASGLAALSPTNSEAVAISRFTDAWEAYFAGAMAGTVPFTDVGLAAKNAMAAALVGMNAAGAGSAKIVAGVTAFWGVLAPGTPFFAAATGVTPPPGLATLQASLDSTFSGNIGFRRDLPSAATAVAASLHTHGGLGGLCNIFSTTVPIV